VTSVNLDSQEGRDKPFAMVQGHHPRTMITQAGASELEVNSTDTCSGNRDPD
jgi:hypothetical protein